MREIIQSAINVSTSSLPVVEEMVQRISRIEGIKVADYSSDPDHNRSVVTLLGDRKGLEEAVFRLFEVARDLLDIRLHRGEHPRIGIVDVVPFTPWRGVTMEDCKTLAWRVGEGIASRFRVPVYFYGEAAKREENKDLSWIRRGGYEKLREEITSIPERHPDIGPREAHPTLGATAVGARGPLVAFNVNLKTERVEVAQKIAAQLREGLKWVKAIGVSLRTRGMVQVSMNLLDFRRNSIPQVMELVSLEARRYGAEVAGAEIIGLVPLEALLDVVEVALGIPDLEVQQVLEYHFTE